MAVLLTAALIVVGCDSTDGDASSADRADVPPVTSAVGDDMLARDPDVPELPFADNPDPNACGLPRPWGNDDPAWLTGVWEGELIESEVLLYDSHLRSSITGRALHGSEVRIVLFQENPTLDYYFVEVADDATWTDATQTGWVPAPFLSFEPVT